MYVVDEKEPMRLVQNMCNILVKFVQISGLLNDQFIAVPSETLPYSLSHSLFLGESRNVPKLLLKIICITVY